jgi:hypothetical protein
MYLEIILVFLFNWHISYEKAGYFYSSTIDLSGQQEIYKAKTLQRNESNVAFYEFTEMLKAAVRRAQQ